MIIVVKSFINFFAQLGSCQYVIQRRARAFTISTSLFFNKFNFSSLKLFLNVSGRSFLLFLFRLGKFNSFYIYIVISWSLCSISFYS
ncbi:hypothetical protein CW304_23330 [Bacillus sp. UFRGS-B20]|nr:hypothetical protein CW304_23330 [Bacillus sp. UFRGS-B20]